MANEVRLVHEVSIELVGRNVNKEPFTQLVFAQNTRYFHVTSLTVFNFLLVHNPVEEYPHLRAKLI